jgi:hypothetical protein
MFISGKDKDIKIKVSDIRSGGWHTACVVEIRQTKTNEKGIAFFEFSPKTKKIVSARFFF